jgi:hypothetical protein
MNTKSFHHGNLESPRLKKLLDFLRQRGTIGATPFDMIANCGTTRPTSDISELRANGVAIDCEFERHTETERKVFRYRLSQ